MPELPEVESVARSLERRLVGRAIRAVAPLDPKYAPLEAAGLAGRTVRAVRRRGKYLFLDLGEPPELMVHLRMTGRLVVGARLRPHPHDRIRIRLDRGELVYRDPRKLGECRRLAFEAVDRRLGPEPLEPGFTPALLSRLLGRSRAPLKAFLLDQGKVAGIGNIYAAEILHRARLDPRRRADSTTPAERRRLHAAVRAVLSAAVAALGTSLSDFGEYRDAEGTRGGFQNALAVYGRAGLPCPACGTAIERIAQNGRSTCFCPRCQS